MRYVTFSFILIWVIVYFTFCFIEAGWVNPISLITDYNELTKRDRSLWVLKIFFWLGLSIIGGLVCREYFGD